MAITQDDIERAASLLRSGGLVALPTETVYGLGADASDPAALARLYAAKGRPADHPVIVHLAGVEQLGGWVAEVPDAARRLAARWWPGPLTLVLRRAPGVLDAVTAGRDSVAVRVPDQLLTLEVLRRAGIGIAAPSANRFGAVSPTTAAHVRAGLGDDVDLILDGGPCRVGVESTIVDLTDPARPLLLREGAVSATELETELGVPLAHDRGPSRAPGMLAAHYAPRARVELARDADDLAARARRGLAAGLRVGTLAPQDAGDSPEGALPLGRLRDAKAYARELYALLRMADDLGLELVVALPPSPEGVGAAVRDRLTRAAAGSATTD
ncbi:unannotated protein [freshwater metagenome]|uniref:Threonylcarbamoyl-AMP synthase n=1 Tax=freshwater metagenome TaxID=449393 RepID=A0A6J7HBD1_9ZZZZ